ncbi:PREDICTED: granulins, partial [Nipponia nippon]|uniref:granulins n=1 Tax=Nipponia nippon TaxID=128390 RepID=UPI00051154B5
PRAVSCPDGRSECPDNATCCMTASGAWGCCPMPQAVCCGDGRHCCPQGTACDLERSTCTSAAGRARPLAALPKARDVQCDEETSCPDGNTCCRLSSGAWGCCPLEEAVCCPDTVHCCANGHTCLQEGGGRRPWLRKTPALARGGNVQCDEETSCPDGSTCCRLSSGAWGCCPLEEAVCCPDHVHCCPQGWSQAVCCPDHVHCCPQGHTCDPGTGSCLQEGGGRRPWLRKTPALARGGNVQCDEETSCPDGSTCCRLSSGAWGCCPLEEILSAHWDQFGAPVAGGDEGG